MKQLPILYSKSSTGAMKQWTISTDGDEITTVYGLVGGKLQTTTDLIKEGKNLGRSNATTPEEQAVLEAESKWTKKKKSGYVESLKDAQAGLVDTSVIEGGLLPMLAKKYSEDGDSITWPAYIQPKFDGHRCIAIVKDGKCELWSRTRKRIVSMPHIVKAIEEALPSINIVLDGELYNHIYKKDFEEISSSISKKKGLHPKHELVQYHIYDTIDDKTFDVRHQTLKELLGEVTNGDGPLLLVQTETVENEDEAIVWFQTLLKRGYEGAMLRNIKGVYFGHQTKRSLDLQKIKEFDDDEFAILDIKEGRGKLQGHAIFICASPKGGTFDVKMDGEQSKLKEFFDDHSLWKNKILTVQYQGYTKYNKPRFPVGQRIRQDV